MPKGIKGFCTLTFRGGPEKKHPVFQKFLGSFLGCFEVFMWFFLGSFEIFFSCMFFPKSVKTKVTPRVGGGEGGGKGGIKATFGQCPKETSFFGITSLRALMLISML